MSNDWKLTWNHVLTNWNSKRRNSHPKLITKCWEYCTLFHQIWLALAFHVITWTKSKYRRFLVERINHLVFRLFAKTPLEFINIEKWFLTSSPSFFDLSYPKFIVFRFYLSVMHFIRFCFCCSLSVGKGSRAKKLQQASQQNSQNQKQSSRRHHNENAVAATASNFQFPLRVKQLSVDSVFHQPAQSKRSNHFDYRDY